MLDGPMCHKCRVPTKGRRFCESCAPLYRMGAWKVAAERMHESGVRPLSIAVRLGVSAKTVIFHLKKTGHIVGDDYQHWLNEQIGVDT